MVTPLHRLFKLSTVSHNGSYGKPLIGPDALNAWLIVPDNIAAQVPTLNWPLFLDTINERRLNQVGRKPIKTEEFIVELAGHQPIFAEQEDAFTQWFEKTPIGTVAKDNQDQVVMKSVKKNYV